jgi:hypothetical protein
VACTSKSKVDEPWKDHQRKWAQASAWRGGVYVVARYDKSLSLEDNLAAVEQLVQYAVSVWQATGLGVVHAPSEGLYHPRVQGVGFVGSA